MLSTKPVLILLLSAETSDWIAFLLEESYEFHVVANVKEAVKTLENIRYDLIMIDDALLDSKTVDVVKEMKRRFQSIPVIVLSHNTAVTHQNWLIEAGADDFLTQKLTRDELRYHVWLMLKQHKQNRSLVQLNHNLHAMASLSRVLHHAADPYNLILQAIKLLSNTFRLYGLAVMLSEGGTFRLYAGSEEVSNRNKLYEQVLRSNAYNPFVWTFQSKIIQIYKDITANPHYEIISILPEAKSVAIIPLIHQNESLGAIGVFAPPNQTLTNQDLLIYEQFAAQLVSALYNVYQHQAQSVNIQFSQHLLRAWEILASLETGEAIGQALSELVEAVPHVGKAFVWFDIPGEEDFAEICVDKTSGQSILQLVNQQRQRGALGSLNELLENQTQPLLLQAETTKDELFSTLFHLLDTSQIAVIPITNSRQLVGGIIAGIGDEQNFNVENINLIENLSHTAGQALERVILTSKISEKNSRLEAILRSISEGIFFVDEHNKVAFCNPQVAEFTSVNASQVIDQDVQVLLQAIAKGTDDPTKTYTQLQASQRALTASGSHHEDYPIVALSFPHTERDLNMEFVRIDGLDQNKISWAGVISSHSQSKKLFQFHETLVNTMSENLRVPFAQLRSMVNTLSDEHGHFNYRERDLLLHQIENGVEKVGQLWNNFLDIYNMEFGGVVLTRDNASLGEILQRILNSRHFAKMHKQIRLDLPHTLPMVKVDEFRIERAIANILQHAFDLSQSSADIHIRVERREHEVCAIIQSRDLPIQSKSFEQLFEPMSTGSDFGLYVAREIIRRHGGRTWAEKAPENALVIALPISATVDLPTEERSRIVTTAEAPRITNRVPKRGLQTIMLVKGRSSLMQSLHDRLEEQEYELLEYHAGEEALADVTATRFDLIVIDIALPDINGLELCERMRARTQVPIILIADKVSDVDKVYGLNAGADDYITKPISNEELTARVQVIFKRQHIPERTSEPVVIGDLYIDFARREVFLASKPLELTRIEYDLLYTLIINRGQVLTHRQLLEKVWGPEYEDETQYLWVNISRLRKKLEPKSDSPRYIHNQPGIGYFFEAP